MFLNNHNLILGETLIEMRKLIEQGIKVDMLLADWPYAVTNNKWDVIIPLDQLWDLIWKITKPNACIFLFGQDKFTAKVMLSMEKHHRYNLIWEKDRPSGFLNGNIMPLRSHEDMMVFYKKLPTYNPQMWKGRPQHGRGNKFKEQINNNYGDFTQTDNGTGNEDKMPRSIWYYKRPHPPVHPTEKPVNLLREAILTYTNAGDTVLDNTMGSGSTGVACMKTGRKFIGIENDPEHFETAKRRITNEANRPELFTH